MMLEGLDTLGEVRYEPPILYHRHWRFGIKMPVQVEYYWHYYTQLVRILTSLNKNPRLTEDG